MEPRQIFAYALIALMIAGVIAAIASARYNTHDRKVSRRRALEADRRAQRSEL